MKRNPFVKACLRTAQWSWQRRTEKDRGCHCCRLLWKRHQYQTTQPQWKALSSVILPRVPVVPMYLWWNNMSHQRSHDSSPVLHHRQHLSLFLRHSRGSSLSFVLGTKPSITEQTWFYPSARGQQSKTSCQHKGTEGCGGLMGEETLSEPYHQILMNLIEVFRHYKASWGVCLFSWQNIVVVSWSRLCDGSSLLCKLHVMETNYR